MAMPVGSKVVEKNGQCIVAAIRNTAVLPSVYSNYGMGRHGGLYLHCSVVPNCIHPRSVWIEQPCSQWANLLLAPTSHFPLIRKAAVDWSLAIEGT